MPMQSFRSQGEVPCISHFHHELWLRECAWGQLWCWLVDGQARTFSSCDSGPVGHQSPNAYDEMNGKYLYHGNKYPGHCQITKKTARTHVGESWGWRSCEFCDDMDVKVLPIFKLRTAISGVHTQRTQLLTRVIRANRHFVTFFGMSLCYLTRFRARYLLVLAPSDVGSPAIL